MKRNLLMPTSLNDVAVIPLTKGQNAIIDVCDVPIVSQYSWYANPRHDKKGCYAVSTCGIRMHRLLMCASDDEIVDHVNGNGLDNRRSNIRKGTQSQNCVNRRTTPGKYMRGARPKKGKWQSYIKFMGKQRSLGYYDSEISAHHAYVLEARKLHGDWMPLPEPPQEGE